ncbi:MAG: putative zinc-binding protein [Cyclobacteriaceae bacterium]
MDSKPIVYSCSGCSSAAQMANYLAIQLDRSGYAEMSCIVGVGGNVKKLVHTAKSGRHLIAIDGCPLACSKACLRNHNLDPDVHIQLTDLGIKKRQGVDFDLADANQVLAQVQTQLTEYFCKYEKDKNTFAIQNN